MSARARAWQEKDPLEIARLNIMLPNREKRAFWLFMLWLMALPLMYQRSILAQDNDFIVTEETAETSGEAAPVNPVELPALSADPVELFNKVSGVSRAGNHQEVISMLQDHEDAVEESADLLAIYLEALINSKSPNWSSINRFARILSGKDSGSSLANYAQGLYYQNSKTPNLVKAIGYFAKAKSAKKPYAGAATAFYVSMVKKYWMLLLVIVLPAIVIVKRRRAAAIQTAEINLDIPSAEDSQIAPSGKKTVKVIKKVKVLRPKAGNGASDTEDNVSDNPEENVQEISVTAEHNLDSFEAESASEAEVEPETLPEKEPDLAREAQPEPEMPEIEDAHELPAVLQSHYAKAQTSAEVAAPSQSVSTPPSQPAAIEPVIETNASEIPAVMPVVRRSPIQSDRELDALWESLSRKALQGKIPPQAFGGANMPIAQQDEKFSGLVAPESDFIAEEPELIPDVSIDLSEDALKDDLIGKLKMLAITDAELRQLFAQKNPAHIPLFIEYLLTRPEPVRLAFVAREIGFYQDPGVIDVLASLLYHEDHRVSLAAIQGLENSKNPSAVLHICPFLRCDVPLLAQASRTALDNFGAVKIFQAFKNLPGHPDDKIREAGVFVLSRMRGAEVEELLKTMLRDSSLEIRNQTILAMSYQKNPVYLDALREFFKTATGSDKTLARKAIVYLQSFASRKK